MLLIIVLSIQIVLTAVVGLLSQQWIHRPENVAILVGNKLTIRCLRKSENNSSAQWSFYSVGNENNATHLTDGDRCLENSSWRYTCGEGNHILNFNCIDKTYAGTYECRSGKKTSMLLTVLESDPVCETKNITIVENNFIEMWCMVNYSGRWAPVMEWGHDVSNIRTSVLEELNENVVFNKTNNSVKSTLLLLADSRRHNSQYYCKTYFTNDSSVYDKRNSVLNVPTYNHTWISPIVNILHGPKNLTITEQLEIYPRGRLNCSAEANPSANYTWTEISSGNKMYGSLLILNENFIPGQKYTFECSAKNDIGQPLARNITFTVPFKPTGVNAIIAGSLISCIIVLLVLVVFAKEKVKVKELCTGRNSIKSLDVIPNHEVLPLDQGTTAPVYSVVHKDNQETTVPVYSVVHKDRETYEQSSSSRTEETIINNSMYMYKPLANQQAKSTDNKNTNLDGIVYTKLKQVPMDRQNRDPNIIREQIKKSEYAGIDHTLKAPPPPPQLIFNINHIC